MWTALGGSGSLTYEPWPVADESLLVQTTFTLPVQVSGAARGQRTGRLCHAARS